MNLLIVDDDIPTTQAVRDCVEKMQLPIQQIEIAYNVVTAKTLLERKKIDIVICDIEMPKYSGIQLLAWVREKEWQQEFIFLTCHADFSYAARAIQYKADAYIIKPVNYTALKNALTQTVEKIAYRRELKRRSEYGELWLGRAERMENALWRELVFADTVIGLKPDEPREEHRKANINFEKNYQLVLCSVLQTNVLRRQWDVPTFQYAAGNIAGEVLFGKPCFARVFDYSRNGRIYIAVVADTAAETRERCARLAQACKENLQCEMTVYVSGPCPIAQLCVQRRFWEQADVNNVARLAPVVENADQLTQQDRGASLDVGLLHELFRQGKAVEAVNVVRCTLETAEKGGQLSAQTLHSIQQDFMQVAFLCLAQEHILAHELFRDKSAKQLEAACKNSVFDMLKWIDYVVKKTVGAIAELRKSETVVEKIKRYIEENCCKELSRETIGQYAYLSPGYAAKLFKQETGYSLRDYTNECKLERAKHLLAEGKKNVSEVAASVGFDNFSYFSTLFKKHTGCSPSEYMRQE